ncbi:MAG: alkaline phosphatase D family protein [Acidimicrobiales bacterium]
MSRTLDRRRFLVLGGASAAAVASARLPGAWAAPAAAGAGDFERGEGPFQLGVASGDPLADAVVIWTRLAPEPLALDGRGGMPDRPVPVRWEIADDERFSRLAGSGVAMALPEHAHTVHVDVRRLAPARWYFYRFMVGATTSAVGRTRTAPAPGAPSRRLAFAFASCQNYADGYYTSYQAMVREELDLVVHVGDYIYEGPAQGTLGRGHLPAVEVRTLPEYRLRHAQYKTDADLQAMHAAAPWIVTWDDHEVENNYADEDADPDVPVAEFLQRRAVAYQAYWEHMPLRQAQRPVGPDTLLYRRLAFGDLAEFDVLDTRQYRSDQPSCPEADCAEAFDPSRTILGGEQEAWLFDGLTRSTARWNVLAQQVPLYEDAPVGLPADKWDGYRVSRQRLLDVLATGEVSNPVVITGDVHFNTAADLKADFADPDSAIVGSEFVGTSISTSGDGLAETDFGPFPDNPHIAFVNRGQRGYVRCELTRDLWRADYRVVDTVEQPTSGATTLVSYVIENGRRGLQRR